MTATPFLRSKIEGHIGWLIVEGTKMKLALD